MKRIYTFFIASLALCSLQAQATLVKKYDAETKMDVSYSQYVLPNGLTILVHEDHSDPVVHLNVTYHVGSARELVGKSGFAHFFEHMLFQGSKNVADEEHFKLIKNYGGDVNGNTTRDRTVYLETFPSNFTETALWLESDRMGLFLEAFTQKKFEIQRSTVKNEKDQRYNTPYGFLNEVADQQLYPAEHPYSWQTIGYVDDLNRADSSDLKNFFLRWYGPNNAAVIVSGDVNTEQVVKWVEKYFGGIKKGPEVRKQKVKPLVLKDNKGLTIVDENASYPLLYRNYVGVPINHPDEPALDFLQSILTGDKKAFLNKRFIENEKLVAAGFTNNPKSAINHELAGEIAFEFVGYPAQSDLEIEDFLNEAIKSFTLNDINDEDLIRYKKIYKNGFESNLESTSICADRLSRAWYLATNGVLQNSSSEWANYEKVTKEDIFRVFQKYIQTQKYSNVFIKPLPPNTTEADKDNYKYESLNPNASFENKAAEAEYLGLSLRPTVDNFNRTIKPFPTTTVKPVIPKMYQKTLKNGIKLVGTDNKETDEINVIINLKGGELINGVKIGPGLPQFTALAMNLGTADFSPEDWEIKLNETLTNISFNGGVSNFSISLNTNKQNWPTAVAFLKEAMFKPRWDKKLFDKDMRDMAISVKQSTVNRATGTGNVAKKVFNGDNVLGYTLKAEDVSRISINDCKDYYNNYFKPDFATMVVGGNISEEQVLSDLSWIGDWNKGGYAYTVPKNTNDIKSNQIFGVDYPNALQSSLVMGYESIPYDYAGEFYKTQVMNFALAGNFNSRLNLDVREDKAWTYGINGGYRAGLDNAASNYIVSAGINSKSTDSAIQQVLYNLQKYKDDGMTKEEFEFTKNALLASESLEYETLGQKMGLMFNIASRDLPLDYVETQMNVLQKVTREELNELAKKNVNVERMVIIVGGDMFILKDKLEKLGLGKVQIMEPDGSSKVKVVKPKEPIKHTKNYE